ncbi:hypothetical protein [Antribacter gilvus]|uniref:hypothetical protein n=1 Tax=Antribacter gilvus TaxID=2304675 RepID=UPI000F79F146|nr:hypothetical protein [Antribacter gilvus]
MNQQVRAVDDGGVATWEVGPEAAARMLREMPPEDLSAQAVGDAGPPLGEVLRAIVAHPEDLAATLSPDHPWLDDVVVRMPEALPDWEQDDDEDEGGDDEDVFEAAAEAVHERLLSLGVEAACPPYEISREEDLPGFWYSLWWD